MSLNKNLKELRLALGISAKEVGEKLGLSGVAILNYEKGIREPNINNLIKLSNLYGVNIEDLIRGENIVSESIKPTVNEIIVFSHISGRVETITCEEHEIVSIGNTTYVEVIKYGEVKHIIPFNRVKQINLNV